MMINGQQLDCLSVLDRGLQYGDGLFETIAIRDGAPCLWERHIDRLVTGCKALRIPSPDGTVLQREAGQICRGIERGVLKLIVTRGQGGRGYQPPESTRPSRVWIVSPWPDYPPGCTERGVKVHVCRTRLGENPALAGVKHLNRLEQVLASEERQGTDYTEGLMLDSRDDVIEGTRTNLFAVYQGRLTAPDLSRCGVAGVMRSVVIELAKDAGIPVRIASLSRADLHAAGEIFLTNSLIGIWPVSLCDDVSLSIGPLTRRLMEALNSRLSRTGT